MDPDIYLIVVNWNGREVTLECLASLEELEYHNYRVVVVDNGSTDGSAEAIARRFPGVILVRNGRNVGFDQGNNIGIARALEEGAEAVLLLNNDTVVDRAILRAFTEASTALPRAGVLGGKVYYYRSGNLLWWAGCRKVPSATGRLMNYTQEGKGKRDEGQYGKYEKIDAVIGCAMYIRREVIEEVGMFDPRFFAYHEEYDFCERVVAAGWKCYFVPSAKIWHRVASTLGGEYSPRLYYFWTRNWLLVSRKQTPLLFWPALYLAYCRESYWIYQGFREAGRRCTAEAALAGAWAALTNHFGGGRRVVPPRWLSRLAAWDYGRRFVKRERKE